MEIFSALLAICKGNSPITGEFPAQRPVTRSFDVFFDIRLNKRLSKQSWGWWFETLSCPLWRHCNVTLQCCHIFHWTQIMSGGSCCWPSLTEIWALISNYIHVFCGYNYSSKCMNEIYPKLWHFVIPIETCFGMFYKRHMKWLHTEISDQTIHAVGNVELWYFVFWQPGPRLNIKTVLSTYGDFHVKDKTAVRTSYL